jgi:D-amino-acid dehydrogenase
VELTRPVYSTEFGMACAPLAGGLRLAGTVEMGGYTAPPNWRRAELLAERGRKLFPDLDARRASRWMGFRPSLPDSLPVLGPAPGAGNAILAFGHGHLGLTLGARTGALVADLAAGRPSPIDLAPYAADRF